MTPKTSLFRVRGLRCAACALRVEKEIKNLPGILETHVDFASQRIRVKFLPEKVSPNAGKLSGSMTVLQIDYVIGALDDCLLFFQPVPVFFSRIASSWPLIYLVEPYLTKQCAIYRNQLIRSSHQTYGHS